MNNAPVDALASAMTLKETLAMEAKAGFAAAAANIHRAGAARLSLVVESTRHFAKSSPYGPAFAAMTRPQQQLLRQS